MIFRVGIQLYIDEIIEAGTDPNSNAYDIIRTPIFRGNWAHCNDYLKMTFNALNTCTCPNVQRALTFLETARGLLGNNDAEKAAYDATLQAQPIPTVATVTTASKTTRLTTYLSAVALPQEYEPGVHDIGDEKGSHVQGCKNLDWRIVNPVILPRNIENTFWLSLAFGLKDDFRYWAELKARTQRYYSSVMKDSTHPRHVDYIVLNDHVLARSASNATADNPTPFANLETQLRPTLPLAKVTPELWQIVADAFKIELLVISHGTYFEHGKAEKPRWKMFPMIPRGDHNSRQVFIFMDGLDSELAPQEYRAIVPVKYDRFQYRYTNHMPSDRLKPPPSGPVAVKDQAQRNMSNLRRCPFLVHDANGVFTEPPTLMAGKTDVSIGPPRAILDDSAINVVAEADILAYWNNGVHNP